MSVSDISPFLPDQDPSRKLSHEHVDAHQYDYRVVQRVRNGSVIDVEVSRDPGVSDLSLYAQRAVLWTLQKRGAYDQFLWSVDEEKSFRGKRVHPKTTDPNVEEMEYEDPEITFLPTGKVRVYIPWAGRAIDIDGRVDDDVLTSQNICQEENFVGIHCEFSGIISGIDEGISSLYLSFKTDEIQTIIEIPLGGLVDNRAYFVRHWPAHVGVDVDPFLVRKYREKNRQTNETGEMAQKGKLLAAQQAYLEEHADEMIPFPGGLFFSEGNGFPTDYDHLKHVRSEDDLNHVFLVEGMGNLVLNGRTYGVGDYYMRSFLVEGKEVLVFGSVGDEMLYSDTHGCASPGEIIPARENYVFQDFEYMQGMLYLRCRKGSATSPTYFQLDLSGSKISYGAMYGGSFDSGIDFDKPLGGTSQLLEQQERDEAYEDLPANHFVIDSLTFGGMGNQSGPTPGVCLFYAFMFAENQCGPSSSQERTDLLGFLRESLGSNKRHIASRKYLEYELAYARLNGFGDVSEKEASFLVGLCVAVKMFGGDFPGSGTRIGSAPKGYANLADQYLAAAEQEWAGLLFDVSGKSLRPTKDPYWDEHYWDALGRSAERPDNDVT